MLIVDAVLVLNVLFVDVDGVDIGHVHVLVSRRCGRRCL